MTAGEESWSSNGGKDIPNNGAFRKKEQNSGSFGKKRYEEFFSSPWAPCAALFPVLKIDIGILDSALKTTLTRDFNSELTHYSIILLSPCSSSLLFYFFLNNNVHWYLWFGFAIVCCFSRREALPQKRFSSLSLFFLCPLLSFFNFLFS